MAGAAFVAVGFIALAPLLGAILSTPVFLIFLHTPAYMVHQAEEHAGDRFRSFVNGRLFAGADVLTSASVLVINLPLVWGLNLLALYAAFVLKPGYGLVAPYAVLLNALAHIGACVRLKVYNPGLLTSVLIFVPLGFATIIASASSMPFHLVGFVLAVVIHLLIVVVMLYRAEEIGENAKGRL